MKPSAPNKHPFVVLSLLVGHGALLGAVAPAASAKDREVAAMDTGAARVVLETHSVRDLGHGYAIARAFVYGPQGVKGSMSMAVDGCGNDRGHQQRRVRWRIAVVTPRIPDRQFAVARRVGETRR